MAITKISNNSLSAISTLPASIPTGALTLLSTQTASSSASISFTSGINSTYDSYVFKFIEIHPGTQGSGGSVVFQFQGSTNSGSTYATTMTTTRFMAYHNEADTATSLGYDASRDLAQSTNFQDVTADVGADADSNTSGYLQIFNPSSTTYVKHFIMRTSSVNQDNNYIVDAYTAGYFNTTSAIDAVQFKMSSGNIDDGIIKMYGVS